MLLTELKITRLSSNDKPDYYEKSQNLKARTLIPDEKLDDLVASQDLSSGADLEPPVDEPDLPTEYDLPVDDNEPDQPDLPPEEPQDPNKAGLLRTVPKAHLVYKRGQEDGTFTELWSYNVSSVKDTVKIRNSILAGTDIERSQLRSSDGTQGYDVWSVGNIEILKIYGLPN